MAATGSRSVVVRSGDTMSAIAARTGLQPVSAWRVPSGDINRIYPGQIVTYGGTSASTASSGVGGHVVRSGESFGASTAPAGSRLPHAMASAAHTLSIPDSTCAETPVSTTLSVVETVAATFKEVKNG